MRGSFGGKKKNGRGGGGGGKGIGASPLGKEGYDGGPEGGRKISLH